MICAGITDVWPVLKKALQTDRPTYKEQRNEGLKERKPKPNFDIDIRLRLSRSRIIEF